MAGFDGFLISGKNKKIYRHLMAYRQMRDMAGFGGFLMHVIQWNLVIKRSDITKPSYNKVILLVFISVFFPLI